MDKKNKIIGIFGGTFDPIHFGHTKLIENLCKQLDFQEIRFMPCNQSSLKHPPHASSEHRAKMVKLAIADNSKFKLELREIKRGGISYMVDSLKEIRDEIPDMPLALIMSQDNLATLNRWHHWQQLLTFAHIICANRPESSPISNTEIKQLLKQHQTSNHEELYENLAGKILLINTPAINISATEIRQQIKSGQNISKLTPNKVANYIQRQKLYH